MDTPSLGELLRDAASELSTRLLLACLILLATWLAVRVVDYLLRRLIKVLDRAVDFMRHADAPLDTQLEGALLPPMRDLIILGGVYQAAIVLDLPGVFGNAVHRIANTLVAMFIFWAFYRLIDVVVFYVREDRERYDFIEDRMIHFGTQIAKATVVLFVFVIVMGEWGYDISALLAGLGLGAAAVSLAAKDVIANLFGYFVIMIEEPFEPGDYIVIGSTKGTVEYIGFRSTRVRQLDQSLAIIPNSDITTVAVVNWSRLSKRRLSMTLSLSLTASGDQILAVVDDIHEMLNAYEHMLPDSVTVRFDGFGENSIDIVVIGMFDIADWGEYMAAKENINLWVMQILNRRGVELAKGQALVLQTPVSGSEPSGEGDGAGAAAAAAATATATAMLEAE